MKVLIIGSTGFIGSSLVRVLSKNKIHTLTISKTDFYNDNELISLLKTVEFIINCAGSSDVNFSYLHPKLDRTSNINIVIRILDIIKDHNLLKLKFINLSSAAVYGNPDTLPVKETDNLSPVSPYGFHKCMNELFLKEYNKCYGINTLSLRIFSAYGIGQKKLLMWDLHEKINKTNGKVILHGTGNESRDFINVLDISKQISLAMKYGEFDGEAINVANGNEIEIAYVVGLFKRYYPRKFDFEFNGELRLGDPRNWCADISVMKNWGYQKEIEIEQGVANYINWAVCQ